MKYIELADEEYGLLLRIMEKELDRVDRYSIKSITDTPSALDRRNLVVGLHGAVASAVNRTITEPSIPVSIEWDRATGTVVCDQCGRTYSRHPDVKEYIDQDGNTWLKKLCDGRLVKL